MSSLGLSREIRNAMNKDSAINNLVDGMKLKTTEIEKLRLGTPNANEMKEGNLVLSFVPSQGLYLFVKYNNVVHHMKFTEGRV